MRSRSGPAVAVRVAVAIVVSVLVVGALGIWIASLPPTNSPAATSTDSPTPDVPSPIPTLRPLKAGLPDPRLTPGVFSADVVPANINRTICVSGYTSGRRLDDGRTVRPPSSYTTALKTEQIAAASLVSVHQVRLERDGRRPGAPLPQTIGTTRT